MVYGLETVAVTKKQVEKMKVAEMKMLRFAMGAMRKNKIRNEYIRGTIKVERLGIKMREGRLMWYRHVVRRDQEYVERRVMEIVTRKEEKREAEEKTFECCEREYGEVGTREKDIGCSEGASYAVATPN